MTSQDRLLSAEIPDEPALIAAAIRVALERLLLAHYDGGWERNERL